jgi:hypothetical protein
MASSNFKPGTVQRFLGVPKKIWTHSLLQHLVNIPQNVGPNDNYMVP